MPKLRLISEAYTIIKAEDPESALTMNGLRTLVKSGKVPSYKIGRKTLVNIDVLKNYLTANV